jgi:[ribosomal protein S5]-alanine N-acetyltransferase
MKSQKEERSIFISGKTVDLCPLDPEYDMNDYISWMNNQETTKFMETGGFVSTRQSLIEYINRYNSSKNLLLGIFSQSSNSHIGNITLHMIDYQNRTGEIGIVVGDKNSQGKGFAYESIRLILHHAFMRLNLHKVCAGMVAENIASKKAFEKTGFILEGTHRKHFFLQGKYVDCLRYGILDEEYYKSLHKPL